MLQKVSCYLLSKLSVFNAGQFCYRNEIAATSRVLSQKLNSILVITVTYPVKQRNLFYNDTYKICDIRKYYPLGHQLFAIESPITIGIYFSDNFFS